MVYSLYPRQLQSEEESVIGWLLWSYREIDIAMLAAAINRDYSLEIYLRWSLISGDSESKEENQVKALHIVASSNGRQRAIKYFRDLYHTKRSTFPLGMRMRFIPMPNAVSASRLQEIKKCKSQQRGWLQSIDHEVSEDIEHLDISMDDMPSLRQMISKMKSDTDDAPLYVGINFQWNSNSPTIFTF